MQRSKEVIVSSQRELDALRKQLLQSSSTGHDPSRGSMSAQVVLQSNLDSMGFQAGNVSRHSKVVPCFNYMLKLHGHFFCDY